jgi:hypothetical protein
MLKFKAQIFHLISEKELAGSNLKNMLLQLYLQNDFFSNIINYLSMNLGLDQINPLLKENLNAKLYIIRK